MADDKNQGEELVLVEVPNEIGAEPPVVPADSREKELVDDEHDDEHAGGEQGRDDELDERRAGHDPDEGGETDEQKRARRRAEKKRRREARRRHTEANQAELVRLRRDNQIFAERLQSIEGRTVQQEGILLNNRITHLEGQIREADEIIVQARTLGNHADSLEAERIKAGLQNEIAGLNNYKQRLAQQRPPEAAEGGQQRQAPKIDPAVQHLAQDWLSDNKWVLDNPAAQKKVRDIDAALLAEGFNPKSRKFWNELDKRVSKSIPNRDDDLDDDDDDVDHDELSNERSGNGSRINGGGPSMSGGSGGGGSRRLRPNEVLITPERKKAMVEAGAWDDLVKKKRMLQSFHEWDKQNPPSKQAAAR